MRRRSNLDFEKRRRSRKTGYRRRKAKKKGFGNLPKAKKKIHLNLEMIASTFTWIFKIVVTCLVAFVAVWYWGQRVSTVGDSMSPVLKNADVVLVNRIVYNASSPKRGDVIVFNRKAMRIRIIIPKGLSDFRARRYRLWRIRSILTVKNWKKIIKQQK